MRIVPFFFFSIAVVEAKPADHPNAPCDVYILASYSGHPQYSREKECGKLVEKRSNITLGGKCKKFHTCDAYTV